MRLQAVTLLVPDYDEGLAFFAAGLGWRVLADDDLGSGRRWVLVAPPGGGSALLLARAATPGQAGALGRAAGGRVALFLASDDFDAGRPRLTAAGARWEEEPRSEPYGRVAVWRDPWGNRWDLLGPPPP